MSRNRLATLLQRSALDARADLALIGTWFVLSRALFWLVEVRPDPTAVEWLWQVLPLQDLANRPFESLWFLHSQPPLYNAIVALCLQLPGDVSTWLHAIWMAVGYGLVAVLFKWFRLAGLPRGLAHVAVFVFAMNPSLILYENFLFYTYLEAFCILGAMYGLARAPSRPAMFSTCASALVGFRAVFQPAWAMAVAAAVWLSTRSQRRTRAALVLLLLPLCLSTALLIKNGLMFGVWSTSTWYGSNIGKLPYVALHDEIPDLYARGIVSRIFVVGIFRTISAYPGELVNGEIAAASLRFGRRSVLLREWKADGQPNFNGAGHIAVSRQMAKDAWAAFRADPYPVLRLVAVGFRRFFEPSSQLAFLDANRARVEALEGLYMRALYPFQIPILPIAALVATLISAAVIVRGSAAQFAGSRTAAAYVLVTVVWIFVVSNIADFGENNRYRFPLDPLMYAWLAMVLWNSAAHNPLVAKAAVALNHERHRRGGVGPATDEGEHERGSMPFGRSSSVRIVRTGIPVLAAASNAAR